VFGTEFRFGGQENSTLHRSICIVEKRNTLCIFGVVLRIFGQYSGQNLRAAALLWSALAPIYSGARYFTKMGPYAERKKGRRQLTLFVAITAGAARALVQEDCCRLI
jgi:hypothetical protein